MTTEKKKHVLFQQRDNRTLEKAASLGLTKKYAPIMATPIGGELTRQEKQWNEREEKDIERIQQRNLKIIRESKNGEKLREWELKNFDEDFQLQWDEKPELHALESQQRFVSSLLMQSEHSAKIKYDTIRKKNSITRREEKKKLQEK